MTTRMRSKPDSARASPVGTALLADIGGTNARFALLRGAECGVPVRFPTAAFPDLSAAVHHALEALGAARVDAVAACAAGPPDGGVIALTNCEWVVSVDALARATGAARSLLVNDFTALAAALPALDDGELEAVGGGERVDGAPLAVLGPGTGLGVSALLPGERGAALVCGEGGHVDLPSASRTEDAILERLRRRFGHVSAERVLSGPGLGVLYRAMREERGAGEDLPGEQIAAAAVRGDAAARGCITQFCAFLGAVAGNLALTLGARGGVYLGGGIVPAWGALFDRDAFRRRFEDKGRYRSYLRRIPTYVIRAESPALRGLARLLSDSAPSTSAATPTE